MILQLKLQKKSDVADYILLFTSLCSCLASFMNGSQAVLHFIVFLSHALFGHTPLCLTSTVWHWWVACCAACGWLWTNVLSLFSPPFTPFSPSAINTHVFIHSLCFPLTSRHLVTLSCISDLLFCIHLSINQSFKPLPLPSWPAHLNYLPCQTPINPTTPPSTSP